jgi:hypothetical protein
MVQHHPASGAPLLLHSNLNKWTLNVPTRWTSYTRRWQVVTPPGWRFADHPGAPPPLVPIAQATAPLGYDVEQSCWAALQELRCQPWFEGYVSEQAAASGHGVREVERIFEYQPATGYASIVLDEHITGVYKAAPQAPAVKPER